MTVIHHQFAQHNNRCTECETILPPRKVPRTIVPGVDDDKRFCSGRCAVVHYKRVDPEKVAKALKGNLA